MLLGRFKINFKFSFTNINPIQLKSIEFPSVMTVREWMLRNQVYTCYLHGWSFVRCIIIGKLCIIATVSIMVMGRDDDKEGQLISLAFNRAH